MIDGEGRWEGREGGRIEGGRSMLRKRLLGSVLRDLLRMTECCISRSESSRDWFYARESFTSSAGIAGPVAALVGRLIPPLLLFSPISA